MSAAHSHLWCWPAQVLSLLAFAAGCFLPPGTARAMAPQPEGPGLDLVVLVDRSASMSGPRMSATRQELNLLLDFTLDLVARSGESNHVRHRLGVVSFGSVARIDLPLAEIRRGDLERLRRTVVVMPSRESLGNTDFLAAFTAAARLFAALSADPSRRRAILLITDGVPYVPDIAAGEHIRELWRFVATNFSSRQTTVDVVILPPAGNGPGQRYARLWRDLSQNRVHELAGDRSDALVALHRLVARMVGTRAEESRPAAAEASAETLVLPPYLDLVVFDILHGPRAVEVAVFAPDALRPLTAETAGVEEIRLGDALWTIVVRHPAPGPWTFRKSHPDARVKILSQQFFPRGILVDPAGEERLRQFEPVTLAYRMVDGNGSPLREVPGYPLSLGVSLVKPDGHREARGMARQPARGPAVFQIQEPAELDLAGRYWTEVLVTTKDLAGRQVKVFQDHWSGFSVEPASRIDCRVTAPAAGESVFLSRFLRMMPVATHLDCRDPQAHPVEMSWIVRGSPNSLFRAVLQREGEEMQAALKLRYLGRGAFRGWLHGAGSPGTYRLQLHADRSRLAEPYSVRFLPSHTSFVRPLSWLDWLLPSALLAAIPACLLWVGRLVWKRRWKSISC